MSYTKPARSASKAWTTAVTEVPLHALRAGIFQCELLNARDAVRQSPVSGPTSPIKGLIFDLAAAGVPNSRTLFGAAKASRQTVTQSNLTCAAADAPPVAELAI